MSHITSNSAGRPAFNLQVAQDDVHTAISALKNSPSMASVRNLVARLELIRQYPVEFVRDCSFAKQCRTEIGLEENDIQAVHLAIQLFPSERQINANGHAGHSSQEHFTDEALNTAGVKLEPQLGREESLHLRVLFNASYDIVQNSQNSQNSPRVNVQNTAASAASAQPVLSATAAAAKDAYKKLMDSHLWSPFRMLETTVLAAVYSKALASGMKPINSGGQSTHSIVIVLQEFYGDRSQAVADQAVAQAQAQAQASTKGKPR